MTDNKGILAPQIRFKGYADLPAGRQALGYWYVYVLLCENGSLYKGKTNHLKRRMEEHFSGVGAAQHTRKYKPVDLVYLESVESEKEALRKEKYLKSGSGREWLKIQIDL